MKRVIFYLLILAFASLTSAWLGLTEPLAENSKLWLSPPQSTGQGEIIFQQPLLLTSAGQSPEIQLAAVLAKRAGLQYQLAPMAKAEELKEFKTLGLVVGASLKGLGAAGIDINKEKARVKELLEEAAKRKIPVLFLHLGGDQRRGELTDALVTEYLASARLAVILKSADNDGLFSKICQQHKIPLRTVEKTAEVSQVLKEIFSQ